MAQLLVETPRRGAGEKYRIHRRRSKNDLESALPKEGVRAPYVNRKEFSEYFAPLKGLLRKSIGRNWSVVYSELVEALRGGGTVVQHVKVHLFQWVTVEPYWIDGKPHHPPRWLGSNTPMGPQDYYVDLQGVLRVGKRVRTRPVEKQAPTNVPIDAETSYVKIGQDWFKVWYKPLPSVPVDGLVHRDIVLDCLLYATKNTYSGTWDWYTEDGRRYMPRGSWKRYAYKKKQISSRTIRREGLNGRA